MFFSTNRAEQFEEVFIENKSPDSLLISMQECNYLASSIVIETAPSEIVFLVKNGNVKSTLSGGKIKLTPKKCECIEEVSTSFGVSGIKINCDVYFIRKDVDDIELVWYMSIPILKTQERTFSVKLDGYYKIQIDEPALLIEKLFDYYHSTYNNDFEHLPNPIHRFVRDYIQNGLFIKISADIEPILTEYLKKPIYAEALDRLVNNYTVDFISIEGYLSGIMKHIIRNFDNQIKPIIFASFKESGLLCSNMTLEHCEIKNCQQ